MYKEILLVLFIAHVATSYVCVPNCKDVCCSVQCSGPYRKVYEGCDCCPTCELVLQRGDCCENRAEPAGDDSSRGRGTDPNIPRVYKSYPRCGKGLKCEARAGAPENNCPTYSYCVTDEEYHSNDDDC